LKYASRIISAAAGLTFIFLTGHLLANNDKHTSVAIEWPAFMLSNVDHEIEISTITDPNARLLANGIELSLVSDSTSFKALVNIDKETEFQVYINDILVESKQFKPIPLWLSILPPFLAIILALVFREVIISLFLGLFLGTLIPGLYVYGILGIIPAFLAIIDTYFIQALSNEGHLSVILFSMIIGATVSLISKNGGMSGVVNRLSKFARSRRSGQLVTWFLGILIFFDDYANTLIVGNTMRPVTDRLKISREKLSYLVDSTAAPMAAIAFVTTWIGAELGYIQDGVNSIAGLDVSVYQIFLNSLQYSFYPVFTLIFMFMIIWMKRDFGPMLPAEIRCVKGENEDHNVVNVSENELKDFEPDEKTVKRAFNAVLPVSAIVLVTMAGLLYTGWDSTVWNNDSSGFFRKISNTIGASDPYKALLWSSLTGLALAALLTLSQRLLSIQETVTSIIKGFKTMLTAMIILVLAWSLSAVTEDLHTAEFLTESISSGFSPYAIPLATFLLASLVSFSTGSSWGTMAILYPMMLPLAWTICESHGMDAALTHAIFYNVVSSVLAGSVLGDHCSPISDTTILSSLASSCNHIEHVRTQLPYAITVGLVSIICGTIPASFGLPFYLSFFVGIAMMYLIIKKFGKVVDG
jgi:Na+/H+ antiporter NhaC